jgi:hypothetical protein
MIKSRFHRHEGITRTFPTRCEMTKRDEHELESMNWVTGSVN